MRYRLLLILISISIMLGTDIKAAEQNDTIYNPTVVFTGMPKKYEIAGIRVTGLQNYEDYIVIGYSGLAVGDIIEIPGDEITNAAKRFWRQGLFSKIQIRVEKICGDKAWLLFDLRQQPRISQINYHGVKKSELDEIMDETRAEEERLKEKAKELEVKAREKHKLNDEQQAIVDAFQAERIQQRGSGCQTDSRP